MKLIRRISMFVIVMMLMVATHAVAKSYGSRSFGGSRRSYSAPRRSTPTPKRTVTKKAAKPKPKSTVAKKKVAPKPKTVAKKKSAMPTKKPAKGSRAEKKLNKKMAKTDKAAAAKYGNRKNAKKAYSKDLAKKNSYKSKTPPAKRPDHIPQNVTINNVNVGTSYGMLPGGMYGYGYMDPVSNMFMALSAHHMMVDYHQMRMAGYGHYGIDGQPIVYHSSSAGLIIGIVFGVIFIGGAIAIAATNKA